MIIKRSEVLNAAKLAAKYKQVRVIKLKPIVYVFAETTKMPKDCEFDFSIHFHDGEVVESCLCYPKYADIEQAIMAKILRDEIASVS